MQFKHQRLNIGQSAEIGRLLTKLHIVLYYRFVLMFVQSVTKNGTECVQITLTKRSSSQIHGTSGVHLHNGSMHCRRHY